MTKSTKPERPIFNWAAIHKTTNKVLPMMFDTRRQGQLYLKGTCRAGLYRVARVVIIEAKRVRR